jgi:hypothetical protein
MFVSVSNSLYFWHKSVVETLKKRKKPKDDKRKHGMLLEAFKSMAKLAIDNGDDETFGHAFARMMPLILVDGSASILVVDVYLGRVVERLPQICMLSHFSLMTGSICMAQLLAHL